MSSSPQSSEISGLDQCFATVLRPETVQANTQQAEAAIEEGRQLTFGRKAEGLSLDELANRIGAIPSGSLVTIAQIWGCFNHTASNEGLHFCCVGPPTPIISGTGNPTYLQRCVVDFLRLQFAGAAIKDAHF